MSNFSEKQKMNEAQFKLAEMDIAMKKEQSDKQFRSQCVQWAMQVTEPKRSSIVGAEPQNKNVPDTNDILANAAKFEKFLNGE